jgi:SAM-dependent methyltransferase
MTKVGRSQEEIFERYIREAEAADFSGWDFSFLYRNGRLVEAPLKWNYHTVVRSHLAGVYTLLDMGTGGGEVLVGFQPLPQHTYATEQYPPNVPVARSRLEPLGVTVVEIEAEKHPPFNSKLPFADRFFDLIINRHEAYYPPELFRILKSGGAFITQQVGSLTNINLAQFFLGKTVPVSNWNLRSAVEELKAAGFNVMRQQEDFIYYRFFDIGAVVYYLKAIPWTLGDFDPEGFSLEKYRDRLRDLYLAICNDGYYDSLQHRFLLIGEKPVK